VYVV